jgi:hypothetical protein
MLAAGCGVIQVSLIVFLARGFSKTEFFLLLILIRPQVVHATSGMMARLTGALALLAFGGAVRASPCKFALTLAQFDDASSNQSFFS